MDTTSVTNTGSTASSVAKSNTLRDLDADQFLKLMITELQNQDPLNPTDNQAILEQINTIRQINASDKEIDTLNAVLLGQNLATASSVIGKQITGIDDAGKKVTGVVDKVTVADGQAKVQVGNATISLKNIGEINN